MATGMAWLTTDEALDMLRAGDESTQIVESLCHAVPEAVQAKTGYGAELMRGEPSELAKLLGRFLIQMWFCPDGTDSERLRHVVDDLAHVLAAVTASEDEDG